MTLNAIDAYLSELERAVREMSRTDLACVVDELWQVWQDQRTVFIIGNGGSAATASHMMNDLIKFTAVELEPRMRAIALTDNIPLMTALANDADFDQIFVEPLRALLRPSDVLIAISASGNSANVLNAVHYAKNLGCRVIGLCGRPGGRLAQVADLRVVVPSDHIGPQEDGHLIMNHAIATARRPSAAFSRVVA